MAAKLVQIPPHLKSDPYATISPYAHSIPSRYGAVSFRSSAKSTLKVTRRPVRLQRQGQNTINKFDTLQPTLGPDFPQEAHASECQQNFDGSLSDDTDTCSHSEHDDLKADQPEKLDYLTNTTEGCRTLPLQKPVGDNNLSKEDDIINNKMDDVDHIIAERLERTRSISNQEYCIDDYEVYDHRHTNSNALHVMNRPSDHGRAPQRRSRLKPKKRAQTARSTRPRPPLSRPTSSPVVTAWAEKEPYLPSQEERQAQAEYARNIAIQRAREVAARERRTAERSARIKARREANPTPAERAMQESLVLTKMANRQRKAKKEIEVTSRIQRGRTGNKETSSNLAASTTSTDGQQQTFATKVVMCPPQLNPDWKAKGFSFGARTNLQSRSDSPGPAQYNLPDPMNQGLKFSMSFRVNPNIRAQGPSPQEYTPYKRFGADAPKAPLSIRHELSEFTRQVMPGPGHYNPLSKLGTDSTRWSFTARAASIVESSKENRKKPGPG